ncbi:ABC transporter ATP-binding protein [Halovenus salina]|uniref:Molybdate/tungstate import ATP-binding protein WtpC n=1 Tax=Halovenus salina TaxID=1510225 RepID=A0ABD5W144_9EURY|nr:ABC transporter ATP-binding protein [Halovenus salina]
MSDVTLDSVTKRYDSKAAVEEIDLTVADGEVLGVIGPSGCGKTTTLRTIAGFETPTAGQVRFDGEDVTHVPPEERNVGLVFQSYALFDNMTVAENVAFGLKMQGVGKDERRERAVELLELLDIAELADRSPRTLSGGQQQRVGLARALAIEPNILLLDEPMTGLDEQLKRRLRTELSELLSELDVTALYVTHDQEEAMVMCDRIAVLNDGTIEQVGRPQDIYEQPTNQFVADFVGTSNVLDGTVADGRIDLGFAAVDANGLTTTDDGRLIVRPDDFVAGGSAFEAVVRDRYYLGECVRVRAELPDGQFVTVDLDDEWQDSQPGEVLPLGLRTEGIHVL